MNPLNIQERLLISSGRQPTGEVKWNLTLLWEVSILISVISASAQNFTDQSLKIAGELKMGTARHYQLLAVINSSLGKYEDALRNQESALEDARKYRIAGQIIWATVGMGDIYRDLGDLKRAEKYYRQAREAKDTIMKNASAIEASLDLRLGNVVSANEYFTAEGSATGAGNFITASFGNYDE